MASRRRTYSQEFEAEAVKRVVEHGLLGEPIDDAHDDLPQDRWPRRVARVDTEVGAERFDERIGGG